MRTNKFSTKKNFAKGVAVVTLLVTCFVFVFALTLSLSAVNPTSDDIAFATQGTSGGTATIYGDHGNSDNTSASVQTLADAGINFYLKDGYYIWDDYTETFSGIEFNTSNVSVHNGYWLANYTFTSGTGKFNISIEKSTIWDQSQYATINLGIPGIFKTLAGKSNVTVTAKADAIYSPLNASNSWYGAKASTSAVAANNVTQSEYSTNALNLNGKTLINMAFFLGADNGAFSADHGMTISGVSIQYTVKIPQASFNSVFTQTFNDGNTIVAQGEYFSDTNTQYSFKPYNYTSNYENEDKTGDASIKVNNNGSSTWPVWYDELTLSLNSAKDSIENAGGNLVSYTNTALGTKTVLGKTYKYYKVSSVTYVGTYHYKYNGASGNGVDANSLALGIKKIQVGDYDEDTSTGALFTGTGNKLVYFDDEIVGYAEVTKTSRSKWQVVTYMFTNATITTKITKDGYYQNPVSFRIKYGGIDPYDGDYAYDKPAALELKTNNYLTNDASNVNSLSWIRENTYSFDTNVKDEKDDGNAPRIWFYTVDKALTLDGLNSIPQRTYDDFDAIKADPNMIPFAYSDIDAFEYDFANGGAKTVGNIGYQFVYNGSAWTLNGEVVDLSNYDVTAPASPQAGDTLSKKVNIVYGGVGGAAVKGAGYYRFTFYAMDLAGNYSTDGSGNIVSKTFYAKVDFETPTFDTFVEYTDFDGYYYGIYNEDVYDPFDPYQKPNGEWATGETTIYLFLSNKDNNDNVYANGSNISGNTLVFNALNGEFGIIFDDTGILAKIEGKETTTFDLPIAELTFAKKAKTKASSSVTVKITYYVDDGYLAITFPDDANDNGLYPTIDFASVFTIYAGQNYKKDGSIYAEDGWTYDDDDSTQNGVCIRVDRNVPTQPTLNNTYDEAYLNSLTSLSTSIALKDRVWFTTAGLSFATQINFGDEFAKTYGDDVVVYIGVKNVTSDADFGLGTYPITDFVDNFKTIETKESTYRQYFNALTLIKGNDLSTSSITAQSIQLLQSEGPGMRLIFVWAVDQAGNVSDLSKYYVLADAFTYTISSNVLSNNNLKEAANVSTLNSDGNVSMSFKRGEVITFAITMNRNKYAPYKLTMQGNGEKNAVLYNYSASYRWDVVNAFANNISLFDNDSRINYILDDSNTLGELDAAAAGNQRSISFEFSRRAIVTYTVSSVNVPYTRGETVVPMAITCDSDVIEDINKAKNAFKFCYLNADGTPFVDDDGNLAKPIVPGDYQVAIYIPTDNPDYVVSNENNVYVALSSGGFVEDDEGLLGFDGVHDCYVRIPDDDLASYAEQRYSLDISNGAYHIGNQNAAFIDYSIIKGTIILRAVATQSAYGELPVLDYTVEGLDNFAGLLCTIKLSTAEDDYTKLNVGNYAIVISNVHVDDGIEDFAQYCDITIHSAFHTIYTKSVNIEILSGTKVYGDADPKFKFRVSVNEFEGTLSEKVDKIKALFANYKLDSENSEYLVYFAKGAVEREVGENVGTYSLTANRNAFDISSNYSINIIQPTPSFTITKKTITLDVAGQYVYRDTFDPAVDYEDIVPSFTLSQADAKYANLIEGNLALLASYTGNETIGYTYTIDLGTISETLNLGFELSVDKDFVVYILGADEAVIRLKDGVTIELNYGTVWDKNLTVEYDSDKFEGLTAGTNVTWTLDGIVDGSTPNVGSYVVSATVDTIDGAYDKDKVFVESFNVVINPAVIIVEPTFENTSKTYGDSEDAFGISYSIVSVGGSDTFDANAIKALITQGTYVRAIYNLADDTFVSIGTRYDGATNNNGLLLADNTKYYGFVVNKEFAVSNNNYVVQANLSAQKLLINQRQITLVDENFIGIDKVVDGSKDVKYGETNLAVNFTTLKDEHDNYQLARSNDDLRLTFDAVYDDDKVGKTTITFTNIKLAGADALNYVLSVDDEISIAYHDNTRDGSGDIIDKSDANHIKILAGAIGLVKNDFVINKQYDGTRDLNIEDISITQHDDTNGIGTSILVNLLKAGKATVEHGEGLFANKIRKDNYIMDVVIVFEVEQINEIIITDNAAYNQDVKVEKVGNTIKVTIEDAQAAIVQREIDAESFESLEVVSREYDARGRVEIVGDLKAGAVAAGENVTVTLVGEIDGTNYGVGQHKISFVDGVDGCATNDENYVVSVDSLNKTYSNDNALYVDITHAKLIPNVKFKAKEYDGETTVLLDDTTRDGTANAFTTLNFTEDNAALSAELATLTFAGGAPTYSLSYHGEGNPYVMVNNNKEVIKHDVLVHGLTIAGDANVLKNYEVYGFIYANGEYNGIKVVDNIPDYELLQEVEVSKRTVIIVQNDVDVEKKIYNNDTDAVVSINVDLQANLIDADKPHLQITATGKFTQKNVGTDVTLNIKDAVMQAAEGYEFLLYNYQIANASGISITTNIYKRPVTFEASLGTRVYSGDALASSSNIVYTITGLLSVDANNYNIQTSGAAYFIDKNVALDENGNIVKKSGTVYNPTLVNEKSTTIMNYLLTYAVENSSGYMPGDYYACEMSDGEIYAKGDKRIVGGTIVKYYYELPTASKYIVINTANADKIATAFEQKVVAGYYVVNTGTEVNPVYQAVYLVDDSYATFDDQLEHAVPYFNKATGTIRPKAVVISDPKAVTTRKYILKTDETKYNDANAAHAVIGERTIKINDEYVDVYLILESYDGVTSLLETAISYSTAFTKVYDGTTKFYGEAGVDFIYNANNIGIGDDDVHITGVKAEFASADAGNVYILVTATGIDGDDKDNYTIDIKGKRIDKQGKIEKREIVAELEDQDVIYGETSNVVDVFDYSLNGSDIQLEKVGGKSTYVGYVSYLEFLNAISQEVEATLGGTQLVGLSTYVQVEAGEGDYYKNDLNEFVLADDTTKAQANYVYVGVKEFVAVTPGTGAYLIKDGNYVLAEENESGTHNLIPSEEAINKDKDYVKSLEAYRYVLNDEGEFEQSNDGDYFRLPGDFSAVPRANSQFTNQNAGTTSNYYKVFETNENNIGRATNFKFAFTYSTPTTSVLTIIKKDMYVTATGEYFKDYGEGKYIDDNLYTYVQINYLDVNGEVATLSGQTYQNVFVKNGVDHRPSIAFKAYDIESGKLGEPIGWLSQVNSGEGKTFNGDYVLSITNDESFVADNYIVHKSRIERDDEGNYFYVFDDGRRFSGVATLSIVLPELNTVVLASSEDGTYTAIYDGDSKAPTVLNGYDATSDEVWFEDANGVPFNTIDAGTYTGTVVLKRKIKAKGGDVKDENNYSRTWRSPSTVTLVIEQASPGLKASVGSSKYNGKEQEYDYKNARPSVNALSTDKECYRISYEKNNSGTFVPVDYMLDAGIYRVSITYNNGDPNYKVETVKVQYTIRPADVVVSLSFVERQRYEEGKGYEVRFAIERINKENMSDIEDPLITDNDLMVQFLIAGEAWFRAERVYVEMTKAEREAYTGVKYSYDGDGYVEDPNGNFKWTGTYSVVPVFGAGVEIDDSGKFVFDTSGRYPFQIVMKDSALKNNFSITQEVENASGQTEHATAAGVLELVVPEMEFVEESSVKATISVKNYGEVDLEDMYLADSFEVRYVYQYNNLAEDDDYYSAIDNAFMSEIEGALGTSVSIAAIVRLNLSLNGNRVGLNGIESTISVELTDEILANLNTIVIYQTMFNEDGTTSLVKLTNYEIKDGVLTYDTDYLGSLVFVKAGRETPMIAVWVGVAVGGAAVVIVCSTALYIVLKKRKLRKELLD